MNVVYAFIAAVLQLIDVILNLYVWALIISAVLSWLVAFDVINTQNRFVRTVGDVLYRITEPLLRPIRRVVPIVGGFDLSPLVLILIIMFIQTFIHHLFI